MSNSRSRASVERLEVRRMMHVEPATIASGGGPNDAVFNANTETLHVIYYDAKGHDLRYQSFGHDGASAVTVVDESADVGVYLSLAQDVNGVLHAAYYDADHTNLKYARRELNGTWSTQVIASDDTTGLYPSITIDAKNRPAIAYFNRTDGNLDLARFDGTDWSVSPIQVKGTIGRYPDLKLNPNTNALSVTFEDSTNGAYRYAEERAGTTWRAHTIDGATRRQGGGVASLNFNAAGRPGVAYYDARGGGLRYAERSRRGKWHAETVASKGATGLFPDLAYTPDSDRPSIAHWNKTRDRVDLATRVNGVWELDAKATGGGANLSAQRGPAEDGEAPELFLVFTDSEAGDLRVGTF